MSLARSVLRERCVALGRAQPCDAAAFHPQIPAVVSERRTTGNSRHQRAAADDARLPHDQVWQSLLRCTPSLQSHTIRTPSCNLSAPAASDALDALLQAGYMGAQQVGEVERPGMPHVKGEEHAAHHRPTTHCEPGSLSNG